ncbi:MAG: helix-turn-helix transcriptional regulator, partial [Mesorhizobium sp.]
MALDKEEMSERVIAIAENLIEAGGAENLKARTIATEAGIAVGSIYNLFRD